MNNIEKVYKYLKINKKAKFSTIWKEVKESKYETKDDEINAKNNLYTDLLINHKFIMIKKDEWGLREFYSVEEIESIMQKNYDVGDIDERIEEIESFTEDNDDINLSFDDEKE